MATIRSGAYGASSSAAASGTISETTGNPTSGDVRICFLINSPGATVTVPTGWTILQNGNTTSTRTVAVFYRVYVPGVGTQTVTFSSSVVSMTVISIGGLNTAGTPQISLGGANASGTTVTAPGLTPSTADQTALVWSGWVFNSPTTGADTVTFTAPSGTTQVGLARPSSTNTGYATVIHAAQLGTAAATGNYTTTASTSTTAQQTALVLFPNVATATPDGGAFFPFLGLGTGVAR